MKTFEILEHTADQAIRAWGKDLAELIAHAAAGMLALMYVEPPPAATSHRQVAVSADDPGLLVHHSLRELLYLLEDQGLAPVVASVVRADESSAVLSVGVVDRDRVTDIMGGPIKAVTYHHLEVHHEAEGLRIDVVFDV